MRDTIDMAREAGLSVKDPQWGYTESHHVAGWLDNLKAFEALVRADEREACARRAEIALLGGAKLISDHVLKAIRARGETK
jgi:hypothetical protein